MLTAEIALQGFEIKRATMTALAVWHQSVAVAKRRS